MSGQLGIWYAQQLSPGNPAYNIGNCVEIHGELDADLLVTALRRALDEADAYRLRFRIEADTPRQYVDDTPDHAVQVLDLSTAQDPRGAADTWMREELEHPVDLTGQPLYRHAVLKLGESTHLWYQRIHHVALDGVSLRIFSGRVADIYTALAEGRDPADGAPESVAVLMDADRSYRDSADFGRDRDFWTGLLADLPDAAVTESREAGPDTHRARRMPDAPARHLSDVGPAETGALKAVARRLKTSFAALMISAAALYHHRTTGAEDIVVGVSVNGRTRRAELAIPGMTSNIMPIRLSITPTTTVAELVRETGRALHAGLRHQRYQYKDILADLRRVGGGALCGLIVNVIPMEQPLRFGDCSATITGLSSGPTEDLKIDVYDIARRRTPDSGRRQPRPAHTDRRPGHLTPPAHRPELAHGSGPERHRCPRGPS
ncbi:hypothetical protein SMIR_40475 [Streptomyces mirabilis]|uniref:condensation domain-containing protein n=1 Tax=Streptomyces mirabilis TaxID=68239 RepID=UPI001BAF7D1B|nr:condensation domain-containing protein [Streptomyces mirabilis]QUW84586.1 hypothetical protein SMIR_40475 [Streptomyces mirabilis]